MNKIWYWIIGGLIAVIVGLVGIYNVGTQGEVIYEYIFTILNLLGVFSVLFGLFSLSNLKTYLKIIFSIVLALIISLVIQTMARLLIHGGA